MRMKGSLLQMVESFIIALGSISIALRDMIVECQWMSSAGTMSQMWLLSCVIVEA